MHRVGRLLLGALLALLTTLALAAPAQAHDYLVSSTPESGTTLSEPPQQVSLQFNTSIGQQFAQVAVVGPDGTTYQDGDPVVDGDSVTQAVSGLPAGTAITVSYRVVSSDGHPIGGTVPFTIAAASAGASAPDPDPAAQPATEPAPSAEAATAPTALTSESGSDGMAAWVMLAGATVVVAVIGVGIVMVRRTSSVHKQP
jgi:methionine-rich copper-binding protein CopC